MRPALKITIVMTLCLGAVLVLNRAPAESMPRLMDLYNEHALSLAPHRDKCVVCHVYADGSGPLTGFGERYDREGLEFSASLIAAYPNLFNTGAGTVSPEPAADAEGSPTRAGGKAPEPAFDVARYYRSECRKCHGRRGDGDPMQGVPAFATKRWLAERSRNTDELLGIILRGKDKMIGHEGKITEVQARELLTLIRSIAKENS